MNVSIIDTSILCELLNIPKMNENHHQIKKEFSQLLEENEKFILPLTTIIETGNHISHIPDGNERRNCAIRFKEYLIHTAKQEAPWELGGNELSKDDLLYLADHFVEYAQNHVGTGDLALINFYQNFIQKTPGLGRVRIWSLDDHLASFIQDHTSLLNSYRRNKHR